MIKYLHLYTISFSEIVLLREFLDKFQIIIFNTNKKKIPILASFCVCCLQLPLPKRQYDYAKA